MLVEEEVLEKRTPSPTVEFFTCAPEPVLG
jgi:hypothetical protein